MDSPKVLIPFNRREAVTLKEAAGIAGRSASTLRSWCEKHFIGRRVADGHYFVSRVALQMLLDNDSRALDAYLAGDRSGPLVAHYFATLPALMITTDATQAKRQTEHVRLLARVS